MLGLSKKPCCACTVTTLLVRAFLLAVREGQQPA